MKTLLLVQICLVLAFNALVAWGAFLLYYKTDPDRAIDIGLGAFFFTCFSELSLIIYNHTLAKMGKTAVTILRDQHEDQTLYLISIIRIRDILMSLVKFELILIPLTFDEGGFKYPKIGNKGRFIYFTQKQQRHKIIIPNDPNCVLMYETNMVTARASINREALKEQIAWISENTHDKWSFILRKVEDVYLPLFSFSNNVDAIAFKLRFI